MKNNMKIYICYEFSPFEGCSKPLAAFSTKEAAELYCQDMAREAYSYRDNYDWVELDVRDYKPL